MPPALFDLDTIPSLRLDVRYAGSNNFMGRPLPGYGRPGAWLHRSAAEALGRVVESLAARRLTLVVFDAYRPVRATRAMVEWCEENGREDLLRGYVGRTSRHNRGVAVDVGLAWRSSGAALPMGTEWDEFHPGSAYHRATGIARVNRRALREAMVAQGFVPYDEEWWHFERPIEPLSPGLLPPELDAPYR